MSLVIARRLSTSLSSVANAYSSMVSVHPVKTKSLTCGILGVTGDFFAQKYENPLGDYDFNRALSIFLVGSLFSGPVLHGWYNVLERLPGTFFSTKRLESLKPWQLLGTKLFLDQIVFGSVFLGGYFMVYGVTLGAVNHYSPYVPRTPEALAKAPPSGIPTFDIYEALDQTYAHTCNVFLPTFVADCLFWPPIQALNFTKVPLRYRVLVINLSSMVFGILLSYMANAKPSSEME